MTDKLLEALRTLAGVEARPRYGNHIGGFSGILH